MAIWYIDLVNGNDANNGTSWAQAWKTLSASAMATSLTTGGGDTIRVAKTPDASSLGSATWTDNQIGYAAQFSSAISKGVDTCKTGWVSLGAGSTVTNSQTTAWVTLHTDNVGKALQWVTSASTNGAYKALGSTVDFSSHQQVCFWFRTTSAFDCTGTQNLTLRFCSDTAGATPVNSVSIPKLSYAANTWYPIVIDAGSALGSNIQSVSFVTTNNTSQTFYIDEIWVSPASGINLRSVISNSNEPNSWYMIRTMRDAKLYLMARFSPTTAQGACSATALLDMAWRGTTGSYTTYKRDPVHVTASAWPGNQKNGSVTGTTANLFVVSGGWDTGTTTQNGETWIDGLAQTTANFSLTNSSFHNYWQVDKFGFARTQSCSMSSIGTYITNSHFVGCSGFTFGPGSWNVLGLTGVGTAPSLVSYNCNSSGFTINATPGGGYGDQFGFTLSNNAWGNGTLTVSPISGGVYSLPNVSCADSSGISLNSSLAVDSVINIGNILAPKTQAQSAGYQVTTAGVSSVTLGGNAVLNIGNMELFGGSAITLANSHPGVVINVGSLSGTQPLVSNFGSPVTFNNYTHGGSGTLFPSTAGGSIPTQMFFQNYGGVNGASRVYQTTNTGNAGFVGMFEAQNTDVRTSGSRAWKYTIGQGSIPPINGTNISVIGCVQNILLASVACEANKLVTVTCYVKRSNTSNIAGILVPAVSKVLPGYTSDITATCSSSGSFEQLTITFTPTAACVVDVRGYIKYSAATATDVVWDDLSITQAP